MAFPSEGLQDADVVLLLGKKLDYGFSFGGPPTLNQDVRIIQVESSSDLIGLSRGVDVSILAACPRNTVRGLLRVR